MIMENLDVTTECLRDLIAFHTERIKAYEGIRVSLVPEEHYLDTLFDGFIRQSISMRSESINMVNRLTGGVTEDAAQEPGKYGMAWSVVKTVFSSRIPTYPLVKCKSGESALLIAYHGVERMDGLTAELRELVSKQKREVIAARDWITHFENLQESPSKPIDEPLLAAVS